MTLALSVGRYAQEPSYQDGLSLRKSHLERIIDPSVFAVEKLRGIEGIDIRQPHFEGKITSVIEKYPQRLEEIMGLRSCLRVTKQVRENELMIRDLRIKIHAYVLAMLDDYLEINDVCNEYPEVIIRTFKNSNHPFLKAITIKALVLKEVSEVVRQEMKLKLEISGQLSMQDLTSSYEDFSKVKNILIKSDRDELETDLLTLKRAIEARQARNSTRNMILVAIAAAGVGCILGSLFSRGRD